MNKSKLDEMQLQIRNKIGNQSFLMLMYLLLIDVGIQGFGFTWLNYPTNIVVILIAISGSYVIRLIMSNAYVGTSPGKKNNPVLRTLITVIVAAFISALTITVIKTKGLDVQTPTDDGGGLVLFIISVIGLMIAGVIGIIKYRQNKEEEE